MEKLGGNRKRGTLRKGKEGELNLPDDPPVVVMV
jgi:hypothetical protein